MRAMASNEYHFVTTWRIPATAEEISAILGNAPDLARWWPSVYLEVFEMQPGDADGVGKVVSLWTKGWLPYTLRWHFTVVESHPPTGFRLEADGDFLGTGIWTLQQEGRPDDPDGPMTRVTYDWSVTAEKGLLKTFSAILRPLFSMNHHWAMRRGEESLRLELARRHAAEIGADRLVQDAIPAPPPPTFPHNHLRRGGSTGA
jgi:hypothetical protein